MPSAAVIAAVLLDPANQQTRTFALYVGGNEMLKQQGTGGNRYGVPLDSIEVTENGPGGVSSLRCSIEDPLNVLPLPSAGQEVLFMDVADDHPEFLGFVQAIDVRPHEGQQGRWLDLTAIGIECLLDWTIVGSLTVAIVGGPGITQTGDAWQAAAAGAGLRDFQQAGVGAGTQAGPIAGNIVTYTFGAAYTIAPATLRETLNAIWNQRDPAYTPLLISVTVDFTRGLRIWESQAAGGTISPDDYIDLTVDDTLHTNTSAELHYTLTPADVVRQVLVIVSGGTQFWFSDGSGIVGQTAIISDSSLTGQAQASTAAGNYLGSFAPTVRGMLHLENFQHGTTKYQAGGRLKLTDAPVGLAGVTFAISSIRKTYHGDGSEEWDISFGGLAPSAMRSIRRQTRSTLS